MAKTKKKASETQGVETHAFEAETRQLLDIVRRPP